MPINQLNKITWIVNTIANAGKISFEDLNRKWRNNVERIFSVERTSTNSTISPERNANTDPPPPLPTKGGDRTPERK